MPKEKAVTKKTAKSTAVTKYDYSQYEGAGFEEQTREDIAIPFMALLQAMSPQVVESNPKGSKPGLIYNPVVQALHKELIVVPVKTEHKFVEWVPRNKGGGFVQEHNVDSDIVIEAKANSTQFGQYNTKKGNELVETFKVFAVVVTEDDMYPAILAFDSSKIKIYKNFNTQLSKFMLKYPDGSKKKPPLWAHLTKMSSQVEENPKGKFFNYKWEHFGGDLMNSLMSPDDPRFEAGAEYYELIKQGVASADYSTVDRGEFKEDADDDIPF